MAIYHLTVKVLSRSNGAKAVGSAAYRSGEKLKDERYDTVHDYSRRSGGVLHSEIMAPEDAPDWASDRETLWNTVEAFEKRKDSQVAREIEVALPRELSEDENRELVRRFVGDELVSRGMIADVAIHQRNSSDGFTNPHAHILLTMRPVDAEGFGAKDRTWNDTALVETWRERWGTYCNEALEAAGSDERVDHRTLEEQGIVRDPTIHMGKEAYNAQAKGEEPERVQPSMVERSIGPYERQIEQDGHAGEA